MATNDELNHIQKQSIAFREQIKQKLNIVGVKDEPLEAMQEPLKAMQEPLEPINEVMNYKGYDVDLIPPELRTMDEWTEIIPEGTKSKVHFTVSIATPINDKFNEVMMYYQTKMGPIARVYKHMVLQLIINEAWERLRRNGQI
jgi:hypothetical protein